jgi:hypothetical protein
MAKKQVLTEEMFTDPWQWVRDKWAENSWEDKFIATETGIPRATVRSFRNGYSNGPRYPALRSMIAFVRRWDGVGGVRKVD